MIMTYRNHNHGTEKIYIYLPSQPNHILPSATGHHAVISPRTIKPLKASNIALHFKRMSNVAHFKDGTHVT